MTTTISSSATAPDQQQPAPPSSVVPLTSQRNDIVFPPPVSNGPTVDSSGYLEPISLGSLRPATTSQSNAASIMTSNTTSQNLPQHSYVNSCAQCGQPHPPPCVDINTNYAKLDDLLRQEAGVKPRDSNHFYVNVNPMPLNQQQQPLQTHSYANLSCPASPERTVPPSAASTAAPASLLNNGGSADEVNYVVLDLDHQSDSSTSAVSPVATAAPTVGATAVAPGSTTVAGASTITPGSQPTSPTRAPEGYATIDFDRTAALSNSANPSVHHHDDSVRKTRHNSNAVPVLC
uniref:Putative fibroblast growth factor receptor substrate 2 n=1 Tax=Rhipicephalus pulchellus TaxID=72859 RepID=L7M4A1_RHIPC